MTQKQLLAFAFLIVFALFGGVWEGQLIGMEMIYAGCSVNGSIKYESWVLAKPIEFKCSMENLNH